MSERTAADVTNCTDSEAVQPLSVSLTNKERREKEEAGGDRAIRTEVKL